MLQYSKTSVTSKIRNMPKITVLMSIYKEPIDWMILSIDSIIEQTYKDFEFIIINDNPERLDNTKLLEKYLKKDSRIKIVNNSENIGLTKSLNKGLAVSTGEYIARMDADDISLPTRFEKQIAFLESNPNVIVLGTNITYIGDWSFVKMTDQIKYDDKSIRAQLLFQNCIPHPSVMIRKSVLDDNNIKYDEEYKHGQDYRLWECLLPFGDFACLEEPLLKYRFSKQQITSSNRSSQKRTTVSVRTRLQKQWLSSNNLYFENNVIEDSPFEIIKILRHNVSIRKTLEYRSFLQYAYFNSARDSWSVSRFLTQDLRYCSFYNIIRILLLKFRK